MSMPPERLSPEGKASEVNRDETFEGYEARLRQMLVDGASEIERVRELGMWLEKHKEPLPDPTADIHRDLARVQLKLAAGFVEEAREDLIGIREGTGVLAKAEALHDAGSISDSVMDAVGDAVRLLAPSVEQ